MSKDSLAMMPWFPRDFIAATRAMRLAERGAYRELLDYQWEMGKLPTDPDRLARLLGITVDEFGELWPAIKDKFVEAAGGLVNQRLEEHREKALQQRDKKRQAAASTNAKRYGERDAKRAQGSNSLRDASASPPSPSPSPSIEEKISAEKPKPVSSAPAIPLEDGTEFEPPAELIRELQAAYKHVSVLEELHKIRAWNLANKGKRKTRRGIVKHINGWLADNNKQAATVAAQQPNVTPIVWKNRV